MSLARTCEAKRGHTALRISGCRAFATFGGQEPGRGPCRRLDRLMLRINHQENVDDVSKQACARAGTILRGRNFYPHGRGIVAEEDGRKTPQYLDLLQPHSPPIAVCPFVNPASTSLHHHVHPDATAVRCGTLTLSNSNPVGGHTVHLANCRQYFKPQAPYGTSSRKLYIVCRSNGFHSFTVARQRSRCYCTFRRQNTAFIRQAFICETVPKFLSSKGRMQA